MIRPLSWKQDEGRYIERLSDYIDKIICYPRSQKKASHIVLAEVSPERSNLAWSGQRGRPEVLLRQPPTLGVAMSFEMWESEREVELARPTENDELKMFGFG